MNKVAIFGNAGGGKSTLSRRLAELTGLPLVTLDLLQYQPGGIEVSEQEYQAAHQEILQQDQWIIEGYGSWATVWQRLEVADTLIYLDLPVWLHYWWVTKRFCQGLFTPPAGWPEGSPLLKSTLNSYNTVCLCHQKLTPRYRQYVKQAQDKKQVFHLQSPQDIQRFFAAFPDQ